MSRNRLTWQDGGANEVLPVERRASAHPATPDEGPASPAYQPDPEANAYENGNTSSWAEDPHPGPYAQSAHPATPDEGPASPAYKAAAEQLKVAMERKAAKCIRVASQLLAGMTTDASIIEDQALDLMDIPDEALHNTLNRLASLVNAQEDDESEVEAEDEGDKEGKKKASRMSADDRLLRRLLAEESEVEAEDEDEGDKEGKKKATDDRLLRRLLAEEGMYGMGHMGQDEDEVEAMLRSMMEEESMDETESMLKSMMEEEVVETEAMGCGPMTAQDDEPEVEEAMGEMDMMIPEEDPMALMDDMTDEEDALLSSLFADSRLAAKKGEDEGDEDEEVEEEVEETEAEGSKKKAAQYPRPKKASVGAKSLGTQTRTASSDVAELEKLWPTAPDVSKVFGS